MRDEPLDQCPDCDAGYSRAYSLVAGPVGKLMWSLEVAEHPVASKITGFLAGRPPRHMTGHDSIDHWSAVRRLGELAGLPDDWTSCKTCGGSGEVERGARRAEEERRQSRIDELLAKQEEIHQELNSLQGEGE